MAAKKLRLGYMDNSQILVKLLCCGRAYGDIQISFHTPTMCMLILRLTEGPTV